MIYGVPDKLDMATYDALLASAEAEDEADAIAEQARRDAEFRSIIDVVRDLEAKHGPWQLPDEQTAGDEQA